MIRWISERDEAKGEGDALGTSVVPSDGVEGIGHRWLRLGNVGKGREESTERARERAEANPKPWTFRRHRLEKTEKVKSKREQARK